MADWIAARPLSWNSGNLWAVHAAADPHFPMDQQSARVLLWGHPEFDGTARADDAWIVHGHTEIPEARSVDHRINVDTGAWQSGRLSAAAVLPDGSVTFLTSEG